MDSKKLIRAVCRQVHPDLFSAHPYAQERNSESLKALNVYVDQLAKGGHPRSCTVEFWVKDGDQLNRIQALLPASGTLGPLFLAFGLITEEELRAGAGREEITDVNFLQWLRQTVSEAISMQAKHEDLRQRIRDARANIQLKYGLSSLRVGVSEFAGGSPEQLRQLEALHALDSTLAALTSDAEEAMDFSALDVHVHHPDAAPMMSMHAMNIHMGGSEADGARGAYVNEAGCIVCVADRATLSEALMRVDLAQARVLTRVKLFWDKRVRDLTPVIKSLLGVDNVWCDTRSEQNTQNFVLWAGYVLEQREAIAAAVGDRRFKFSLLVHSDEDAHLIDWNSNSSVLQVRSDCTPKHLVDFLVSEISKQADAAAVAVQAQRLAEAVLLEKIRAAFNAKHVIQVCSSQNKEEVLAGAQRLLESAEVIKSCVDLTGASLAIDECYEVWGSGFISIPYNFELTDLKPQLVRLLGAGSSASSNGAGSTNGAASAQQRRAGAHANGSAAAAAAGATFAPNRAPGGFPGARGPASNGQGAGSIDIPAGSTDAAQPAAHHTVGAANNVAAYTAAAAELAAAAAVAAAAASNDTLDAELAAAAAAAAAAHGAQAGIEDAAAYCGVAGGYVGGSGMSQGAASYAADSADVGGANSSGDAGNLGSGQSTGGRTRGSVAVRACAARPGAGRAASHEGRQAAVAAVQLPVRSIALPAVRAPRAAAHATAGSRRLLRLL